MKPRVLGSCAQPLEPVWIFSKWQNDFVVGLIERDCLVLSLKSVRVSQIKAHLSNVTGQSASKPASQQASQQAELSLWKLLSS